MVDLLPDILALLVLFVAVPLNWYVSLLLWRIVNADPEGATLRVVAVLATSVALLVTVFGLVFVNNGMADPILSLKQTQIITRGSLLILSVVPTVYWLRWYQRNGRH